MLQKWLTAGFGEKQRLYLTAAGVPQGGICSPVIANLTLDGLERLLRVHYPPNTKRAQRAKVNLVRYGDGTPVQACHPEGESPVTSMVPAEVSQAGGLMEGCRGASARARARHRRGLHHPCPRMSLGIRPCPCRRSRRTGQADRAWGCMDLGTTLQGPGCEGRHAAPGARRRPGELAASQGAAGNGRVEGGADGAAGSARRPWGSSSRRERPGNAARGQEPCCRPWGSKACGRSDGPTATNGVHHVRHLQSALDRAATQDHKRRFESRDDQGWSVDVLWAAWRQVTAHQGAPGGEGLALAASSNPGYAAARRQTRPKARRAPQDRCAPVRRVARPQPHGGPSPRGLATGHERVGPTALQRLLEPLLAADVPDGSDGSSPTRAAQPASQALRHARSTRAGGGGELDGQADLKRLPPRQRRTRSTRWRADGHRLQRSQPRRTVGTHSTGQVGHTQGGGPQRFPALPVVQPPLPAPSRATVAESRLPGAAWRAPPPRRRCGRLVGEEAGRTAGRGQTARTVGGAGHGAPSMTGLVRHGHGLWTLGRRGWAGVSICLHHPDHLVESEHGQAPLHRPTGGRHGLAQGPENRPCLHRQ